MLNDPEYIAWLRTVPTDFTADPLWRMSAYRYSLFLMTKSQDDLAFVLRCQETRALADQLIRAIGGISANIEDGYSRSSGRERAHFYEYSLSCSREGRGWYFRCGRAFPPKILTARLTLLTQIVRILTAVVPDERTSTKTWRKKRDEPEATPPTDNQQ